MPFNEQPPEWNAQGVEPPLSKKNEGWAAAERPPADYWDWQMNRTFKTLQELQQKAAEKADVGDMSTVPTVAKDAAGAITELHVSKETPDGAQAKVNTLAGIGNTKTVKQLDDAQAAHVAESVTDVDGVHGLKIEDGIFTPILFGGSTTGSPIYTHQYGYYQKVGKRVFIDVLVITSNKGGMVGDIAIGGLPFASTNDTLRSPAITIANLVGVNILAIGNWQVNADISQNSTGVFLLKNGTKGENSTTLNDADITDNFTVRVSGSYITN